MTDERPRNPHTGQPLPDETTPAPPRPSGAGAFFEESPGPDPKRLGEPAPAMASADPAYEVAAKSSTFAEAQEATAPPSQQEMAIRSALETVMDPEIGLSVVDLGLIREIVLKPGHTHVKMMLTTPFCPYAPQMMEDVKQAAMSVVPQVTEVELLADPWSPELMPDPSLLGYSF